ncbi:MAG: MBL fold metallo-hydrolase [Acidisphaera sp.]|nr:MBL fold metallo-hydrolase [Acidisphaera sp.]
MPFLTEPEPARGVPEDVIPGVRRIVADNPTPMTFHGTNTYLIEGPDGLTVLDPGPDQPAHVRAVLGAADGRIARILLSHTHHDHLGALPALRAATGAPTYGFSRSGDPRFVADVGLAEGDTVAGLTALHTPGHAPDHLCFAWRDGVLFSADHVMAWSTTVVSPPGGDMRAYFASLARLLERDDRLYLPGHGPPLPDPHPYVRDLLAHRRHRENAIRRALASGPADATRLMEKLYSKLNPTLRRAAERNVLAHLLKLEAEGAAVRDGDLWSAAQKAPGRIC